jgi:transcriptional regulator
MYVPSCFAVTDTDEAVAFIRRHPFAVLTTWDGERPVATHIPLQAEVRPDGLWLTGHLARANPQWSTFGSGTALAVFQGPHAYVSASWYGQPHVPTWNYMAVHVYGQVKLASADRVRPMLRELLDEYERGQAQPVTWDSLPEAKLAGLLDGLVAFELKAERVEAAYKLSQNRSEQDYRSIIEHLEAGGEQERQVAEAMRIVRANGLNRVYTAGG